MAVIDFKGSPSAECSRRTFGPTERKKQPTAPQHANGWSQRGQATQTQIAKLELENSRLRRVVTDLLLEKMNFEEAP
jgi:hypothetical protein